jgi:hypothetical protein
VGTPSGVNPSAICRSVARVPKAGLEPARPFEQSILSAPCLPFHHFGLLNIEFSGLLNIEFSGLLNIEFSGLLNTEFSGLTA